MVFGVCLSIQKHEAIWKIEKRKKKPDIDFSRVSGFVVNALTDMSEKLKCRQLVLMISDIKWMFNSGREGWEGVKWISLTLGRVF